mmetsp:Transcript_120562/g.225316  ORF Transcript_120562/g.225316 Transcript_120562/m.225316 type:complete len:135 (-) Transcript_120562:82-486(-)
MVRPAFLETHAHKAGAETEYTEQIPLTPAGFALLLLKPPWIFVILGVIGCCALIFIIRAFWDSIEPYFFALLDFIALIVRFILAVFHGIFWSIQRCFYPVKECFFSCVDTSDTYFKPYKLKRPAGAHVAGIDGM